MTRTHPNVTTRHQLVRAVAISYLATRLRRRLAQGDYNHLTQYVSELNATGTASAWRIDAFGFGRFGLLGLALSWVTPPVAPFAGTNRVGYWLPAERVAWIGSALFPGDPGYPMEGSLSRHVHNPLGGVPYMPELWSKVGDGERRGWRIVGVTNLPHLQRGVIRHDGEYRCFPSLTRGS